MNYHIPYRNNIVIKKIFENKAYCKVLSSPAPLPCEAKEVASLALAVVAAGPWEDADNSSVLVEDEEDLSARLTESTSSPRVANN